jgi:hypothetical protein
MSAHATVRLLCPRCLRPVAVAEVDGERTPNYRVPEGPSAKTVRLCDVPPDVPAPLRVVRSMAELTAAHEAMRAPWHQTVIFPAHFRCPADLRMRQEKLDALVLAAVGAGETSLTLGG